MVSDDDLLRFRGTALRNLAESLLEESQGAWPPPPLAVFAQAFPDDVDLAVAWTAYEDAEVEAVMAAWSQKWKWATGKEGEE